MFGYSLLPDSMVVMDSNINIYNHLSILYIWTSPKMKSCYCKYWA